MSPRNQLIHQRSSSSLISENDTNSIRMKDKNAGGFSTVIFEVNLDYTTDLYGKFLQLKSLNSPYLAKYVEFTRLACDSTKIALTSEHPKGTSLSLILSKITKKQKYDIAYQVISAVEYLHKSCIYVGYLTAQNVIVNIIGSNCFVKLVHYGTFQILGDSILSNVYNIFTLTPERIMKIPYTKKLTDYYALGILLMCIQMGYDLHSDYSIHRYFQAITSILLESSGINDEISLNERQHILFPKNLILGDNQNLEEDSIINEAITKLLIIDPYKRKPLKYILKSFNDKPNLPPINDDYLPDIQLHLWKLCGKSIERNLLDSKFIHVSSSLVMLHHGHISRYLKRHNVDQLYAWKDYKIFVQPDKNYHLAKKEAREYLALKNMTRYRSGYIENDVLYRNALCGNRFLQFVELYEDKNKLSKLLQMDIPNSVRCSLWSNKLSMKKSFEYLFYVSNNSLALSCKHQLSLDLPRCHQYDEAMTSISIQSKITLLIEKVLAVNSKFSAYWQGLDSLIAPFAILYSENIEAGFAAAFQLIDKFTPDYFARHSSHSLEESLKLFAKLISFNYSTLAKFLRENGLTPSTFAVAWLLTCYAHLFPFHKLFRIYDEMYHRTSFYPLCIGLAILELSSDDLMEAVRSDEAFKVLSNISDLDVSLLLKTADKIYEIIPCSCFYRKYAAHNWEMKEYKVEYNEIELEDLLVPKIDPADFLNFFIKNEALLVLCNNASNDNRIISINDNILQESDEKKLKEANNQKLLIGVIGDDKMRVMKMANILTEKELNKVCVLNSTWITFKFTYDLD